MAAFLGSLLILESGVRARSGKGHITLCLILRTQFLPSCNKGLVQWLLQFLLRLLHAGPSSALP